MRRFIMAAMLVASSALAQEPLFDADGYRIAHYRAPVRQPPAGVGRFALARRGQSESWARRERAVVASLQRQ